jgi:hypothetical protein
MSARCRPAPSRWPAVSTTRHAHERAVHRHPQPSITPARPRPRHVYRVSVLTPTTTMAATAPGCRHNGWLHGNGAAARRVARNATSAAWHRMRARTAASSTQRRRHSGTLTARKRLSAQSEVSKRAGDEQFSHPATPHAGDPHPNTRTCRKTQTAQLGPAVSTCARAIALTA